MKSGLSKSEAKERLRKLRAVIDRERHLVHVLDQSSMSEAALDSLKHELTTLEEQFPDLITPDSPSQRVAGKPVDKFRKVKHSVRMFSLTDVFSFDELSDWDRRWRKIAAGETSDYLVDMKLDGLAVTLRYDRGQFALAATRGDGFIGEDVTHTVRTIQSVPLRLSLDTVPARVRTALQSGSLELRGEVVMHKQDFLNLNKRQQERNLPLYANPRNVSAGTIRQLDPQVTAERKLRFYAWELLTDIGQQTLQEGYDLISKLGFQVNPQTFVAKELSSIEDFFRRIESKREKLPFWIDGIVVKVNKLSLYQKLGYVGKTPRAATAWKFSAEQATTVVEDIVVQVGRTGALTPVAHLQPVQVAGTTVARATLHNADEIARLDVRIGDTIILQKAGDIIPEVVSVVPNLRPASAKRWGMIRTCPACKTVVQRKEGEAVYFCINPACPAKQREQLYHFVSKSALDVVGLGPSILDILVDEGLVQHPADLFSLTEKDLIGLPLFAEKKAANIVAAIQDRRQVSFERFLYGLGIRHVGSETARTLATHVPSLQKLKKMTVDDFRHLPDVGNVVAESLYQYFHDGKQLRQLEKVMKMIYVQGKTAGKLTGKTYVVTGTLETFSRSEAEQAIRDLGGHVSSSVSKNTTGVIVGADPGSKAEKAITLGVPTLTEADFRQLLKG